MLICLFCDLCSVLFLIGFDLNWMKLAKYNDHHECNLSIQIQSNLIETNQIKSTINFISFFFCFVLETNKILNWLFLITSGVMKHIYHIKIHYIYAQQKKTNKNIGFFAFHFPLSLIENWHIYEFFTKWNWGKSQQIWPYNRWWIKTFIHPSSFLFCFQLHFKYLSINK